MEKLALHDSLRKHFPTFRNGKNVIWDVPRRLHGATSHKLAAGHPPSKPMQELAKAMIAEACIGKNGDPADFVLVIDDVELANLQQEDIITAHFREAVRMALTKYDNDIPTQNRYKIQIQERCSFHLLKPMVESYFFKDENALSIAGVPPGTEPKLVHPSDLEQFQTNDSSWLPTCKIENAKHAERGNFWWRHECHSKCYLEHLVSSGLSSYDETNYGKRALFNLDWRTVSTCVSDVPIIRSLFEDISFWFGVENPIGAGNVHSCFYPDAKVKPESLILRNM